MPQHLWKDPATHKRQGRPRTQIGQCTTEGCRRPKHARGLCSSCYWKANRHKYIGGELATLPDRICVMPDCEQEAVAGRAVCAKHWREREGR